MMYDIPDEYIRFDWDIKKFDALVKEERKQCKHAEELIRKINARCYKIIDEPTFIRVYW